MTHKHITISEIAKKDLYAQTTITGIGKCIFITVSACCACRVRAGLVVTLMSCLSNVLIKRNGTTLSGAAPRFLHPTALSV